MSITDFCKIKRQSIKHLGLKQLKQLLSSCSSKFWSIFYYLLKYCWSSWLPVTCKDNSSLKNSDCIDKKGQLAHLLCPISCNERLCCVSYQKDAAFQELYLAKCIYSFLANICCGFEWFSYSNPQLFTLPSSSHLFCSSNCAHSAVFTAPFLLEGRQPEVQASRIVSVVWSVDL